MYQPPPSALPLGCVIGEQQPTAENCFAISSLYIHPGQVCALMGRDGKVDTVSAESVCPCSVYDVRRVAVDWFAVTVCPLRRCNHLV